jgi:hypothetical protein
MPTLTVRRPRRFRDLLRAYRIFVDGALIAKIRNGGSVDIQVTNDYRDPVTNAKVDIKVVDLQYWDKEDNKWRSELTDNKRINTGQTAVWNKNLEYIGGETGVKIKIYFKYEQAGGGWSTDHTELSDAFKCVDGTSVPILVN